MKNDSTQGGRSEGVTAVLGLTALAIAMLDMLVA
jgi:hypothetical protein